ncbi:hypothetical protein FRB99_000320 [Tulasnella sp. 403]|nr:hypothetical protein FRB99_000320 [Tulasnella sp. 403]
MVKVSVNGTVIAESTNTTIVEGNHYFPPDSIINKDTIFTDSSTHSVCPWKGNASYYNLKLPGGTNISDVAWYYPEPKEKAKHIKGFVAFYKNKVTFQDA